MPPRILKKKELSLQESQTGKHHIKLKTWKFKIQFHLSASNGETLSPVLVVGRVVMVIKKLSMVVVVVVGQ